MLGWEFPPYFAGGVGVVCYHLSKALCQAGAELTFVMPTAPKEARSDFMKMIVADRYEFDESLSVNMRFVDSLITPYGTEEEYKRNYDKYITSIIKNNKESYSQLYGANLLEEIWLFAMRMRFFDFASEGYDLIHAHDWTTFPAAIELKKMLKKPVAVHIHITEYDKNGGFAGNPRIHEVEQYGMDNADVIVAISNKIKQTCIEKYHQDPNKIVVIHNGAEEYPIISMVKTDMKQIEADDKIVLFAGRVTLQKGPEYFIDACAKVAPHVKNAKFILAGTGDLLPMCMDKVSRMGLSNRFMFTGFYTKETAIKLFNMADIFIMPSVSEPFGLVPFEAMWANTPTIISKQSGVSEVLNHCVKVDFWDTDKMADAIINILNDKTLNNMLVKHGKVEVESMTWDTVAQKCLTLYNQMVVRH
jgi:glycosyltransferase involved in cell wall biosynthesis